MPDELKVTILHFLVKHFISTVFTSLLILVPFLVIRLITKLVDM